ncbi:MAG: transcriptional regulator [Candidatus Bathyarchaeia archaeon]
MSKDQALGAAIFLMCLIITIGYIATLLFPSWLGFLGLEVTEAEVRFWTIATPVFIAFIAIMCIGAWIGWIMATTPPPKPIEEIKSEIKEKKETQIK